MIKRYNNLSLAIGGAGLALQAAAIFIDGPKERGEDPSKTALVCIYLGFGLLVWGLALYAKAKGRSPIWGLAGFLSIFGLVILAMLEDLTEVPPQRLYSRRELDEVFGPPAPKFRNQGRLVGSDCSLCDQCIIDDLEAAFCSECGHPAHRSCMQPRSSAPNACSTCGCTKPPLYEYQVEESAPVDPSPRPIVVTLLGASMILSGAATVVSLVIGPHDFGSRFLLERDPSLAFLAVWVRGYAGSIALIVSGVGMLRRKNWARILYIVWTGLNFVLMFVTLADPMVPRSNLLVMLLVWALLFLNSANRYFRTTS